jgi:hypothetical protein
VRRANSLVALSSADFPPPAGASTNTTAPTPRAAALSDSRIVLSSQSRSSSRDLAPATDFFDARVNARIGTRPRLPEGTVKKLGASAGKRAL